MKYLYHLSKRIPTYLWTLQTTKSEDTHLGDTRKNILEKTLVYKNKENPLIILTLTI